MTSSNPDTTGSLRAARQIDELCDRFEATWKTSKRLKIEDLLQECAGAVRLRLLEELLLLEVNLRKRAGEMPVAADYAGRFAELSPPVLGEILRRGLGEVHVRGSTPGNDSTVAQDGGSRRIAPPRLRYFGDYELLEQIARGGMGVVYKARQISLNRLVAVKMILSGQFASDAQVKRFRSEAESAAQLDHPNIVSIYEVGEHDGDHYFSMALVEGTSLAAKLTEGPMEPRRAAELIGQVAQAIEYAHSKGVIHRDLKPSNVLLDANDRPRVTDFGLAKRVSDAEGLTMSGDVLGTPSYMPPEQAAGKIDAVGPASDVYALGAVLYALVAGRPPFQAASSHATLTQVVEQEPVRLRQLNNAIPRDLETITQKCLEKSVARRYSSAAALANDLGNYLAGRPIQARPTTRIERVWRWCTRNPLVASLSAATIAMLFAVAVVSTAAYLREAKLGEALRRRGDDLTRAYEKQKALTASETKAKNDAVEAQAEEAAAKQSERTQRELADQRARDLARTAYNSDMNRVETYARDGNFRPIEAMLRRHIPQNPREDDLRSFEWFYWWNQIHQERQSISLPAMPEKMALSADGKYLAVGCEGGLAYVWETPGMQLLPFSLKIDDRHWSALQFLSDSRTLCGAGWNSSYRSWDLTEHAIRSQGSFVTTNNQGTTSYLATRWPAAFSPDGTWMLRPDLRSIGGLFNLDTEEHVPLGDAFSGVYVMPPRSANSKQPEATSFTCHVVRPPGKAPVGSLTIMPEDMMRKVAPGTAADHLTWPADWGGAPCFGATFSPNGKLLAAGHRSGRTYLYSVPDGILTKTLAGHRDIVWSTHFSEDSQQLVTGSQDGQAIVWDVTTGRLLTKLKHHPAAVRSVRWVNNGGILTACDDGAVRHWKSPAETPVVLRGHTAGVADVALNQETSTAYSIGGDQTLKIWSTKRPASAVTTPSTDKLQRIAASADGSVIVGQTQIGAVIHVWGDAGRIYRGRLRGNEANSIVGRELIVSPDGRLIAASELWGLRVWDSNTLNPVGLFKGQILQQFGAGLVTMPGFVHAGAFSPDNELIAVPREAGVDSSVTVNLHRTADSELMRAIPLGKGTCLRLTFSPDGKRVFSLIAQGTMAIADGPGTIQVHDVATGELLAKHELGLAHKPVACDWSADGRWLAVVMQPPKITPESLPQVRIYKWEQFELYDSINVVAGHQGVLFTADSKLLALPSADREGAGRVYSLMDRALLPNLRIAPLLARTYEGQTTLFSSDRLLQAGNGQINVFRWPELTELEPIKIGGAPIANLQLASDGKGLKLLTEARTRFTTSAFETVRISLDGTVQSDQTSAAKPLRGAILPSQIGIDLKEIQAQAPQLYRQLISATDVNRFDRTEMPAAEFRDEQRIALVLRNQGISLWAKANTPGKSNYRLEFVVPAACRAVCCAPDGKRYAHSDGQRVVIRDRTQSDALTLTPEHGQSVIGLDWSPDGRWIASLSEEGEIRLWDGTTGKMRTTVPKGTSAMDVIRFTPDSKSFVCGSRDGGLSFGDPTTGEIKCRLQAHASAVRDVDFSSDGTLLASAGSDGFVRYWRAISLTAPSLAEPSVPQPDDWKLATVDKRLPPSPKSQEEAMAAEQLVAAGLAVQLAKGDEITKLDELKAVQDRGIEIRIHSLRGTPPQDKNAKPVEYPHLDVDQLQPIGKVSSLRSIELVERRVTPAGWRQISGLPELRTCIVRQSGLTDVSLEGLAKSTELETLYLGETRIHADDWPRLRNHQALKNLGLGVEEVSTEMLEHVCSLKSLELLFLPNAQLPADLTPLLKLSQLRNLDLRNSNVDDSQLEIIKRLPSLARINLEGTKITFDGAISLFQAKPALNLILSPELGRGRWQERAALFGMPKGQKGYLELSAALDLLKEGKSPTGMTVPRLNLTRTVFAAPQWILYRNMTFSTNMSAVDWEMLAALDNIEDLQILSPGGAGRLATADLSPFPGLETLSPGEDGSLAKALRNKRLTRLWYSGSPGTTDMDAISEQFSLTDLSLEKLNPDAYSSLLPLSKLVSLRLSKGEVQIEMLAKNCPHLTSLQLDAVKLGTGRLRDLAEFGALQTLVLEDMPITDDQLDELAAIKSLKKVKLTRTKTTTTGVSKFQKAHPNLKVDR